MDAQGNFIVTWDNWYMGGELRNVYARTFNSNAEPVDEFQVNSEALTSNLEPAPVVAMNGPGDYVVAWSTLEDVYASVFNKEVGDPSVDIYANGETFGPGDTMEISVKVDNSLNESIDLYVAISVNGLLFWYPVWDNTPYATEIDPGIWNNIIASFTLTSDRPVGSYNFYSAITEQDSFNLLGLDSITVNLE